jgi:hypothetical protein
MFSSIVSVFGELREWLGVRECDVGWGDVGWNGVSGVERCSVGWCDVMWNGMM